MSTFKPSIECPEDYASLVTRMLIDLAHQSRSFDSVPLEPITLFSLAYESSGVRKRGARACAGLETAAVAADLATLLRARKRRHCRRRRVSGGGPQEPGFPHAVGGKSAA